MLGMGQQSPSPLPKSSQPLSQPSNPHHLPRRGIPYRSGLFSSYFELLPHDSSCDITPMAESQFVSVTASENFCDPDANMSFISCDRVIFRVHSKYLDVNAGGFPPGGLPQPQTGPREIELTEKSNVVELLFQHVWPKTHPQLDKISFDVLAELAEAAEKYQVYSAMEVCRLLMKKAISAHPLRVLAYAATHDYTEVADLAALPALAASADEALQRLSIRHFITWVRYRDAWTSALRTFAQTHLHVDIPTHHHNHNNDYRYSSPICTFLDTLRPQVMRDIVDGVQRFHDVQAWKASRLTSGTCSVCANTLQPLFTGIEGIPTFSAIATSFNGTS